MKKNTTMQAGQLYALIPHGIVKHFADQKKVNAFDICEIMVQQNPSWVNRLFDNEASYCLNDLNKDFKINKVNNDYNLFKKISKNIFNR